MCAGGAKVSARQITVLALSLLCFNGTVAAATPVMAASLASSGKLPDISDDEPDRPAAALPVADALQAINDRVDGFTISTLPDWVEPVAAFDPAPEATSDVSHGYHSRLHDFQYNGMVPGESSYFNAVEYRLTNPYGVENYSSIEISFDPSYEQLTLHELWIKRGDVLIDKLPTARFDMLRTESDRAELIYDGTRTLAIVLNDVRSGDRVRYSYSVDGENPIYGGHREFRVHTELWSELDRQYTRVLTSSDRPFNRRIRGQDVPLQITDDNGIQEIVIDQRGVGEYELEEGVPSWHYNRGTIVFSDMKDWRSVVDWALPMYELPEQSSVELATIASVIRSAHGDVDEQIGAALRWVQEEVRYFGVELGKNSHWPSRPEETLARRFGDCKDKAFLLVALLRELGVQAQPALVNTNRGLESANYPYRMHAFDHVIVHVMREGESHFIDPTRRNQAGALGQFHEPDYGRALILSADTTGLSEMGNRFSRYQMSTHKTLRLPRHGSPARTDSVESGQGEDAVLEVVTSRQGALAEKVRLVLERDGPRKIEQDYVDYYSGYFTDIAASESPEFNPGSGSEMVVNEQYRIPDIWQADENVDSYRWLFADDVLGYLDKPDETRGRQQPYELVHPVVIEETWDVLMPEAFRLDELNASLSNDWVSFSKESTVSDDGRHLQVTFRFKTKANEVPAKDLPAYARSVKQIEDMASFYVEDKPSMRAALSSATSELTSELTESERKDSVVLLVSLLVLLVLLLVLVPLISMRSLAK